MDKSPTTGNMASSSCQTTQTSTITENSQTEVWSFLFNNFFFFMKHEIPRLYTFYIVKWKC